MFVCFNVSINELTFNLHVFSEDDGLVSII